LTLPFSTYAGNPIVEELEKLDIEGLHERQQKRDQIDIDLDFKRKKDREEKHQQEFSSKAEQQHWNKSEQIILKAKKRLKALQNKLKVEGDWGGVKLDMQGLKGKDPSKVNLEYEYDF
jgi:hypothetical protein